MKKIISIVVLLLIVLATSVSATETLADELYALGEKYGMTVSDKIKIERYLADNSVTEAQEQQILAKAQEAVQIMESNNVTTIESLSKEDKDKLKTIANEGASVLGLSITFQAKTAQIYKDGKLVESVSVSTTSSDETGTSTSTGVLVYTGNEMTTIITVSALSIIALVVILFIRRKNTNV